MPGSGNLTGRPCPHWRKKKRTEGGGPLDRRNHGRGSGRMYDLDL